MIIFGLKERAFNIFEDTIRALGILKGYQKHYGGNEKPAYGIPLQY